MIITKFQGRLGNQIFQYAFALNVSKKFSTYFLIDNRSKSVFFKYFKTKTLDVNFLNRVLLKLFRKKIKNNIYQVGTEEVDEMKQLFANDSYYDGFFQSEQYFNCDKTYLQKRIVVKKKFKVPFNKKYDKLFRDNEIIAIHCRLGDYIDWGSDELGGKNLTLPQSYYQNALSQIDQLEKYKIIIVTDDLINIKNRFSFLDNKIIVSENEIIDFQILQNAHLLIISNSSFSWWAAYLNTKNAVVYAPEFWLGFKVKKEFPIGILPDSFIKIPVY
jgi:hypothetical protein